MPLCSCLCFSDDFVTDTFFLLEVLSLGLVLALLGAKKLCIKDFDAGILEADEGFLEQGVKAFDEEVGAFEEEGGTLTEEVGVLAAEFNAFVEDLGALGVAVTFGSQTSIPRSSFHSFHSSFFLICSATMASSRRLLPNRTIVSEERSARMFKSKRLSGLFS